MADFADPAAPAAPVQEDQYQNLGPAAPPPFAAAPAPAQNFPALAPAAAAPVAPFVAAPAAPATAPAPRSVMEEGVQELESEPSDSYRKRTDTKKPKIQALKKKMKRVKIIYWTSMSFWFLFLVVFIILHINHFGIHLLPFLTVE